MKTYTVGIIGNGRFGDLVYKTLDRYSDQFIPKIFSKRETPDNEKFFSIEETCKCDIVIPTVPISRFEDQVKAISPLLKGKSLVVDVCSVNVHPEKVLLDTLPENIDILSTHPMFGPDSTKDATTYKDLKFVFHKTRVRDEAKVSEFLEFWKKLGCEMIEMTPDEHDKQAAYTHAYAFLIGKIGMKMGVRKNQISTKGFELGILYNQEAVENDTGQLFEDMMEYNPYAREMRGEFNRVLINIEASLS